MSFFSNRGSLLCLPYAGGGTADFHRWPLDTMPACLPGRERRLRERAYRSMPVLIEDLVAEVPVDAPYAIYGHSMGAWIAFELVRAVRTRGLRQPKVLLVGARQAPHIPTTTTRLGRLPQTEFLEGMQTRYGGIPRALLDKPELLKAFLPALRADVVMLDDYVYVEKPPLDIPLVVFTGRDDLTVSKADAHAWAAHTTAEVKCIEVPGGHFFLREPGFATRLGDHL